MKTKNMKKRISALGLAMTLVLTSLTGCSLKNYKEEEDIAVMEEAAAIVDKTSDKPGHSNEAGKVETVYVIKDSDSNNQSVLVNEWLKNPEGKPELPDSSSLKDITVIKGSARLNGSGDNITWSADGEDVYYRGKSDKKLPVDVHIRYELDGKEVKASALEHANGHLKMTFEYKNNEKKVVVVNGEKHTIYQPFVMMSGAVLLNEKAYNIKVDKGTVVNTGEKSIVIGAAIPGLKESIDLKGDFDFSIPEKVVVEADVKDFSLAMTLTVATNDALSELKLDDDSKIDDIKEDIDKLTDGMNEIVDGAVKLADGTVDLKEGARKLDKGVGTLKDGAKDIKAGVDQLDDGAGELKSGAKALKDGVDKLDSGAIDLKNGAKSLKDGSDQVNDGTGDLKDGLDQMNAGMPTLSDGVAKIAVGSASLSSGAASLVAGNKALNDGADALESGLNTLNSSLSDKKSQEDMKSLVDGSAEFKTGVGDLSDGLDRIAAGYAYTGTEMEALLAGLGQYSAGLKATGDQANITYAGYIDTLIATYKSMYDNVSQVSEGAGKLKSSYDAIDSGIGKAANSVSELGDGVSKLAAGAASLKGGIFSYTDGASKIASGAKSLDDGVQELNGKVPTITGGIDKLTKGAKTLSGGTSSLSEGASRLYNGTKELKDGTGSLVSGASKLYNGTKDLKDGTLKLNSGVSDFYDGTKELKDGTGKLASGASKLSDGAADLKDGVKEYNEQGIKKLSDKANDIIVNNIELLKELKKYSKEYTSFGGCEKGTDSKVKFIFKTDSIGE